MVKKIRAEAAQEGATVLVLSAGDINTGAPESNMFMAKPDIEAMNSIGYEAMVVGNHEFDVTADELAEQQRQAKFPFLGANIKRADGSDAFDPYIIKDVQGKKIAIVGLTTAETPNMSSELNRVGLNWEDPVNSQSKLIKQLKKENDMVIALSHLGFFHDEEAGKKYPGDITLAKANPEIDVIIGGHSHTELPDGVKQGKTSIFQAKESGMFLGRVDVDLSGPTPKVMGSKLIPVKNVIPDKQVAALLDNYLRQAKSVLDEKVGKLKGKMPGGRGTIKIDDNPLGNFVAESHKRFTHADIGISNARSMRTGLDAGEITMRDLTAVSPFKNTVTYVELSADELWKTMEIVNENYLKATDQNIYFSKGFELVREDNVVTEIRLNGKRILRGQEDTYRIAMGNFLSEMVHEFNYIKIHPTFVNTGKLETEAMATYFREFDTIDDKKLKFKNLVNISPCDRHLLEP